jgi:hypothetical protein
MHPVSQTPSIAFIHPLWRVFLGMLAEGRFAHYIALEVSREMIIASSSLTSTAGSPIVLTLSKKPSSQMTHSSDPRHEEFLRKDIC